MKIFLSSTVEGLRDTRITLVENIQKYCKEDIIVVCYEKDGKRFPRVEPEETCLKLVRECQALLLLVDQYYGTPSKSDPSVSITHLEVLEAQKLANTVIPVARTQTWNEFFVWRRNQDKDIEYAHVREPNLFKLMEHLFSTCNFHVYDNLTTGSAIEEIASAIDGILAQGVLGEVERTALPMETPALQPPPHLPEQPVHEAKLPTFQDGQVLSSRELNALYRFIAERGRELGLQMSPKTVWKDHDLLTAEALNQMLDNLDSIYQCQGKKKPSWTFTRFRNKTPLRASQLNEIASAAKNA